MSNQPCLFLAPAPGPSSPSTHGYSPTLCAFFLLVQTPFPPKARIPQVSCRDSRQKKQAQGCPYSPGRKGQFAGGGHALALKAFCSSSPHPCKATLFTWTSQFPGILDVFGGSPSFTAAPSKNTLETLVQFWVSFGGFVRVAYWLTLLQRSRGGP